jgi:hypothetical protein
MSPRFHPDFAPGRAIERMPHGLRRPGRPIQPASVAAGRVGRLPPTGRDDAARRLCRDRGCACRNGQVGAAGKIGVVAESLVRARIQPDLSCEMASYAAPPDLPPICPDRPMDYQTGRLCGPVIRK